MSGSGSRTPGREANDCLSLDRRTRKIKRGLEGEAVFELCERLVDRVEVVVAVAVRGEHRVDGDAR